MNSQCNLLSYATQKFHTSDIKNKTYLNYTLTMTSFPAMIILASSKLDRSGGPAVINYGVYSSEAWYKGGELYREGGPAQIWYNNNGTVTEIWCINGQHRRLTMRDGVVEREAWSEEKGGRQYRLGAPAVIEYNADGAPSREEWYEEKGERHRLRAPAVITYWGGGTLRCEEWYEHGKEHRRLKPAVIQYHEDGTIEELGTEGIALGAQKGAQFEVQSMTLPLESLLFLYTDGVVEAHNEKGELFGKSRLLAFLQANRTLEPQELIDRLTNEIDQFSSHTPQHDDITAFSVKLN